MTDAAERERPKILVFGSINVDLVARVASIPRPGETMLSPSYATMCGGKGANQAVAAARMLLPGCVAMVGRVGDDAFGSVAIDNLKRNGVDTGGVVAGAEPTGCAFIAVDAKGENAITVAAGANGALSADDVPENLIAANMVTVLQMEVPVAASLAVARRTKAAGGRTLWNLAPAPADMAGADLRALLEASDILMLNEHEALTAANLLGHGTPDVLQAARSVAAAGGVLAILTAGARGATAFSPDGSAKTAPALDIRPVDTTGAGDTFVGILAASLASGHDIEAGLRIACIGASLACLAAGAQTAMPTRADLQARL